MDLPWPFSVPEPNGAAVAPPRPTALEGVDVRRACLRDLPVLATILAESFHHHHPAWFASLLRLSIQEDLRLRLRQNNPEYACWVAVLPIESSDPSSAPTRQIVGTIELGLRSPINLGWPFNFSGWFAPRSPYLYIANLAVPPAYRRQGIAKRLLEHCVGTAQTWGRSDLYLHVLGNNTAAQQLYQGLGFHFYRIDPSLESFLLNRSPRQLWHRRLSSLP